MAAAKTKSISISEETKARGMTLLSEHFPPGVYDWAFFSDLLSKAMDSFEAGELSVLGITVAPAGPRIATDRSLRGASRASQGSSGTPGANAASASADGNGA